MLPNLIIIGAMKCATSALHHYLSLHPSIVMSVPKELDFFVEGKNWNKGLDWYESHFDTTSKQAKVYGEASPSYTGFPAIPGVAERMHSVVPDTKLIYLVRHPIERIISHYMHRCAHGEERRSISEALTLSARGAADRSIYILRSKYYMQVAQFLNFFPRSSLFIASQEDLLGRRRDTLAAIFRFLGVDETIDVEEFSRLVHESRATRLKNPVGMALAKGPELGILRRLPARIKDPAVRLVRAVVTTEVKRPLLDERLCCQLIEFLREDIEQFRRFTGRPFPGWTESPSHQRR